jgi:gluconolactonase
VNTSRQRGISVLVLVVACASVCSAEDRPSVVAPGAKLTKLEGSFEFTEGPTADAQGNVCFSDVRASRTYQWSPDGKVTLFRKETGNANGLAFDGKGNLLACEGDRGRVTSIDPQGKATVVADQYRGQRFNQPNDLWIDPQGGVYFSDPIYGRGQKTQDGENVYYVSPDRQRVVRVIDDMVRPNGLVGTPDGKMLYVSDHGAKRIYLYDIKPDGTLSHKRPFAPVGADGMKLDSEGNVYMAENGVLVYDSAGKHRETIEIPEQPTNLCFAGPNRRTLFITARPAIYTLQMRVAGANVKQHEARLQE